MDHPSHETSPHHSGNSAPESAYRGDRDPKPTITGPNDPTDAQVIPPRGGDGDGDCDDKQ